jgi:hypothetical protein
MRKNHHAKMQNRMHDFSRKLDDITTFARGSEIEATSKAYKLQFRLQAIPRLIGYGNLKQQLRNEIYEQDDKH